ncbi:non-heme chloroperoxidase [Chitinivorax tropicus]|uniref:Non-heme chloroperoxidase n=1 Tax=Chitinivorax tropicus TaxID=714531 RepID=A0A840MMX0_9PROT|nr:alpha/beta fold hydrolase [Chitinivorax tropicus]MBB5018459.1 non-heme chloroperoxidase [Chitinivorax tropicus]
MFNYRAKPSLALEVLHHPAANAPRPHPILFIHGAYSAAWCWEPHFLPFFAAQGYDCHALSLRGHGGSEGHEYLSLTSIDDYLADIEQVVATLPQAPILIGHSMGGMLAQLFCQKHPAAAAILMASVPPEGLLGATMQLAFREPQAFFELNLIHASDGRLSTIASIRRQLFSDSMPEQEAIRYLARFQPESHRAILDLSFLPFRPTAVPNQVPVLVLGAEKDGLFPPYLVHATASRYGVKAEIFPNMAHVMMLEPHWQQPAQRIAGWLAEQGL